MRQGFVILSLIWLFSAVTVSAAEIKSFSVGELIRADEINSNFAELEQRISAAQPGASAQVVLDCSNPGGPLPVIPAQRPLTIQVVGECTYDELYLSGPGDVLIMGEPGDGGDFLTLNGLYATRGTHLHLFNLELRTGHFEAISGSSLSWDIECSGCVATWGMGAQGAVIAGGELNLAGVTLYPWQVPSDFGGTLGIRARGANVNLKDLNSQGVGLAAYGSNIHIEGRSGAFNGPMDVKGSAFFLACYQQSYCDPLALEVWASSAWIEGTPGARLLLVSSTAKLNLRGGSLRAIDVIGEFSNEEGGFGDVSASLENSRIRSEGGGINFSNEGSGGSLVNGVPIQ